MMNRIASLLLLSCLTLSLPASAQSPVRTKAGLTALDSTVLKVIRVYPDSFPGVSLIFKAETKSGAPVWDLRPEQVKVTEDGRQATLNRLEKISKDIPVNISLVVDHSGSMEVDPDQDTRHGRTTPLEAAKQGVRVFLGSMNAGKDSAGLIAFDDAVKVKAPLSRERTKLLAALNELQPEGLTAFYDALGKAIDALNASGGIKAIVALTDGEDNSSKLSLKQLLKKAKASDIPIYVIGLGDVDKPILKKIARETGGLCYFTRSSQELSEIYANISRKVQAVYQLQYTSPSLASADSNRNISIQFDVEGLYLKDNLTELKLPEEVIARLKTLEAQMPAQQVSESKSEPGWPVSLWGGAAAAATVTLAGAGVVMYRYRRLKLPKAPVPPAIPQVSIGNIFPNPATEQVTVNYSLPNGTSTAQVHLYNMYGEQVFSTDISGEGVNVTLHVGHLPEGTYLVRVDAGNSLSEAVKLVVARM